MTKLRSVLICALIIVASALTNNNVRQCMNGVIANGKACHNQLETCFSDVACSNEFDDLFEICHLPPDDSEYDPRCPKEGYVRSKGAHVRELMDCLETNCGMLSGSVNEGLDKANDEEFIKHYEETQAEMFSLKVASLKDCVMSALVEADKCWLFTKDCDENCMGSLDQVQVCSEQIESGRDDKAYQCMRELELSDEKAGEVRDCLLATCFVQKKVDL